jgi:3-hydroxy-9,10-secoandrosta-1,3,5(10)-triene-9,17-dione monooxygenase reductase component
MSEPARGVDQAVLRQVMASYPTGVTIVTSQWDGQLCGMAANSFTSVSLDPPIVLVCCQRHARTAQGAKRSGRFAVHILRHDQVEHARAFVGRDALRFDAVPHSIDPTGVPILDDWLALLVCDTYSVMVAGDHEVLFGEVTHCERVDAAPLLFHESALRMLPKLPPVKATSEAPISEDDDDLYDSLVRVLAPPSMAPARRPGRP